MAGRVSQTIVEVDAFGQPSGRVTQVTFQVASFGTPHARSSQVVKETLAEAAPEARISQLAFEASAFGDPNIRVSELVFEILCYDRWVPMPVVYPTLPGIDINVTWRPKAVNFQPQIHTSGNEVRVGAAQYPLHEFELQYNLLRDRPTEIELKTMLGFFLSLGGSLNGFNFQNPWDYFVVGQSLATTDGINSQFGPLVRTYGADGYQVSEPVGYVDLTQPFHVYIDGNRVDPSDATWGYTVQTTQPVNQQLKFNNTPAAGHVVTIDMSYFYYVRFSDDTLDFDQILWRIWELKKVKLMSLRGW